MLLDRLRERALRSRLRYLSSGESMIEENVLWLLALLFYVMESDHMLYVLYLSAHRGLGPCSRMSLGYGKWCLFLVTAESVL